MATRLTQVVIDSADVPGLASWWAAALGWEVVHLEDESSVVPPPGEPGIELVFVPVNDDRLLKNRIHLDLRSNTLAEQDDLIQRLMARGATEADIGQGDVLWAVLKDPEGNEFCVLDPRPEYADTGALAAIVVDAEDPPAMARFWIAATGWKLREDTDDSDLIPPGGVGPWLEFVNSKEPHTVKNRLHLDIAPFLGDDQEAEVNRLIELGARPTEVGQSQAAAGTVTWVVLADPEQNEFCVLSAR